jgi:hydroxyacid-oxoacid transhydrogenase
MVNDSPTNSSARPRGWLNGLLELTKDVAVPSGIAEFGLSGGLGSVLAKGAIKQQRRLDIAPRQPSEADLGHILNASMKN